jgi:hypothetical protein
MQKKSQLKSILYFHQHVNYISSQTLELLGLVRFILNNFSSLNSLKIWSGNKVKLSLCSIKHHVKGNGGKAPPFLTSTLDGGEGSASRHSGVKSPRYPLYRRLSGPQSLSLHCGVEKNHFVLAGNWTSVVQPVARRYADWAIPPPLTKRGRR